MQQQKQTVFAAQSPLDWCMSNLRTRLVSERLPEENRRRANHPYEEEELRVRDEAKVISPTFLCTPNQPPAPLVHDSPNSNLNMTEHQVGQTQLRLVGCPTLFVQNPGSFQSQSNHLALKESPQDCGIEAKGLFPSLFVGPVKI